MEKEKEFIEFIKEETQKVWQKSQSQLLLSSLLPLFKENKGSEFNLEKGVKLKKFINKLIKDNKLDGVKLFEPKIKAKIGLIPKDENIITSEEYNENKNEKIVFEFLSLVDKILSESDKEKIIIPLNILIKLTKI